MAIALNLMISRKFITVFVLTFSFYSVFSQEIELKHSVEIPEPLMFDLVRGLGAKQGELEINALADFPINNTSERDIEWAPEIEYALFDGFAVELEFPFENFELEAIKMAVQWTIGQSKSNKYIHGIQVLTEIMLHESIVELSALYVPGYRFNDTWSMLGLFGIMLEVGEDVPKKKNTILLNTSIFANVNENLVLGLELNNTDPTLQGLDDNEMSLLILPQVQYEFNHGYEFQFGVGPKITQYNTDTSAVLRVIKTF